MLSVHFGAGNIGRGFIGEVLASNNFKVTFVDIADNIINHLNQRGSYEIELASERKQRIEVKGVNGINSRKNPTDVIQSIKNADLITTSIGPNALINIAPIIAEGIIAREDSGNTKPCDVIACENMIGGSQFLKEEVSKILEQKSKDYLSQYIGFPNAAVDRIVPNQKHDDPLFVSVEPFKEWIIDKSQIKNNSVHLNGVEYADDLVPYIERKLLSVNTGHATVAYTGYYRGHRTIGEAMNDSIVVDHLIDVLEETGQLLCKKWNFQRSIHAKYQQKILERFQNSNISDDVERVGRTPIRKMGYNERFILPIRQLKKLKMKFNTLIETVGMISVFNSKHDEESQKLQNLLNLHPTKNVIKEITELKDNDLIEQIVEAFERYNRI
jgi:mannitol-1-phosphate 5-dehydrogenase